MLARDGPPYCEALDTPRPVFPSIADRVWQHAGVRAIEDTAGSACRLSRATPAIRALVRRVGHICRTLAGRARRHAGPRGTREARTRSAGDFRSPTRAAGARPAAHTVLFDVGRGGTGGRQAQRHVVHPPGRAAALSVLGPAME